MQPLTLSSADLTAWLGQFFWPFARVSGLLLVAPLFGSQPIPRRLRLALALLITVAVLPATRGSAPAVLPWSAGGVLLTAEQLLIGLAMGFVLLLVFNAVALAGESIALAMGLGFAVMSDPQNGVPVPVLSQFFLVTASLLFLAMDGHLALIHLLAQSFTYLPLDTLHFGAEQAWRLLDWSRYLFTGALAIALPAVIALLAVNVAMGVMTRAAPQLNIFSVGFPLTLLVGFVAVLLALPALPGLFEQGVAGAWRLIETLLGG